MFGGQKQASGSSLPVASFNASHNFGRPSLSNLPASASAKQKAQLPLGFVLTPMTLNEGVHLVNFGGTKVVRCTRCRGYVNPYVKWENGGRRWVCNLCLTVNDTPNSYFCSLDENSNRLDRAQRPELSCGCVEYVASGDYMTRPPMAPCFVFVIDVSLNAINIGFTETVCNAIKTMVTEDLFVTGERTQITIITFDNSVHFYNINSSGARPQISVVSDLDDVFLPLTTPSMLVSLSESKENIVALLEQIPSCWRKSASSESCATVALQAAQLLLRPIGGRIQLFMSTMPNLGDHKLNPSGGGMAGVESMKSQRGKGGESKIPDDVDFIKPGHSLYYSVAHAMAQCQICCDLFVAPMGMQTMDIATLSSVAVQTGGYLKFYPFFRSQTMGDKLRKEIISILSQQFAWESVIRVRISKGWAIKDWFGRFYFRGADLMMLPSMPESHAVSILFDCQEQVVSDPFFYLQCAVLYTHSHGERRIRVQTYCLPATSKLSDISMGTDVDVVSHLLCLMAMREATKTKMVNGRQMIQTTLSNINAFFSANYPSVPVPPQEALIPLPDHPTCRLTLLCLGMLKSAIFRESKEILPDVRVTCWHRINGASVSESTQFFIPLLMSLHDMDPQCGTYTEGKHVILPPALRNSARAMSSDGVYMAYDGDEMLMWVGKTVSPNWLRTVFGAASFDQFVPEFSELTLGSSGTPESSKVAAIVDYLKSQVRGSCPKLIASKQGDPLEAKFLSILIEDRTHAIGLSLVEFWNKFGPRITSMVPSAGSRWYPTGGQQPGVAAQMAYQPQQQQQQQVQQGAARYSSGVQAVANMYTNLGYVAQNPPLQPFQAPMHAQIKAPQMAVQQQQQQPQPQAGGTNPYATQQQQQQQAQAGGQNPYAQQQQAQNPYAPQQQPFPQQQQPQSYPQTPFPQQQPYGQQPQQQQQGYPPTGVVGQPGHHPSGQYSQVLAPPAAGMQFAQQPQHTQSPGMIQIPPSPGMNPYGRQPTSDTIY